MSEHKRRQAILATIAMTALAAGETIPVTIERPMNLQEEIEYACREYDAECGTDTNPKSYHFMIAGATLRLRMREILARHPK